jgi:hypothetical protein
MPNDGMYACACTNCLAGLPSGADALAAPSYAIPSLLFSDAMRWNYGAPLGTPVTLSYSFLAAVPSYYDTDAPERNGFRPFNAAQRDAVRRALASFSEVANINFVETADGLITFGSATVDPEIEAYTYVPLRTETYQEQGDVWLNNAYGFHETPTDGSYAYMALLHEIGHALGLKHSFEGEEPGFGTFPVLPNADEHRLNTVMSYNPPKSEYHAGEPRTPMLYDIAALQYLYGANNATRSGDTVYSWTDAHTMETIWDAGGIDTIDFSSRFASDPFKRHGVHIDLREGQFTTVSDHFHGKAWQTIGIAFGTVIENAIGTRFQEMIIGNDAANWLDGHGGGDGYTGGGGADHFVMYDGRFTVTDFTPDVDKLALDAADFGLQATGTLADAGVTFAAWGAPLGSGPAIIYLADAPGHLNLLWDADGSGDGGSRPFLDLTVRRAAPIGGNLAGWKLAATGDFDADGTDDLVWRNTTTGQNVFYKMQNGDVVATDDLGTFTGWEIGALGDFNADGAADIIWSNTATGSNFLWLMRDGLPFKSFWAGDIPGWTLATASDLNGDGTTDLLWRHIGSGENYLWLMADGQPYASYWLGTIPGWQIAGGGDVDGNGTDDLLWQHQSTGQAYLWLMQNGQPAQSRSLGFMPGWATAGIADMNGDSTEDILWHHHNSGSTSIWDMSGGVRAAERPAFLETSEVVIGVGDFTGDGTADMVGRDSLGAHRVVFGKGPSPPTLTAADFVVV